MHNNVVIGFINPRAVRNKTDYLKDYINDNDLDALFIVESRLTNADENIRNKLISNGYKLLNNPRQGRIGDGIAILHKAHIKMSNLEIFVVTLMEAVKIDMFLRNKKITYLIMYRPEPTPKNRYRMGNFFKEFGDNASKHVANHNDLIILGDFNIHMNKPNERHTVKFKEILYSLNHRQHVVGPNHISGYTLDLIITGDQYN